MGQLTIHWFTCNHLYPQWNAFVPFGGRPDQDIAPAAAIHASICPECLTPLTNCNKLFKEKLMSVKMLEIILDIPVTDGEFIHSMVHFYARGDHLRWEQPITPGARFLPGDPYLDSLEEESYMNTCDEESDFGLNVRWINYLPKSTYFYFSLMPLIIHDIPYATIQQAEAEHQTPATAQRVQTPPVAHPFVQMDPSVAQSDPFVSNPASASRGSNAQMVPGPNGPMYWLRKIPKINTGPRILRRKSCPDRTPPSSSGDETWSMVSDSPDGRWVPCIEASSRTNPSETAMDNDSENSPINSAADTSVPATENEYQESASFTDDDQLSQSADVIASVTSSDSPLVAPNMEPDVLEYQSSPVESNPWLLSSEMMREHSLQVRSPDESSSVLYPVNENTPLDDFMLSDPCPDLPAEEPQSLQDLLATELEIDPNGYDLECECQQDISFGCDFILYDSETDSTQAIELDDLDNRSYYPDII
ncbi:hypothetical protein BO94DRAFT_542564 [Aspergillus sclerotioniger CBS 115572]|uniref:Uncharacterized protein n=1 Tax=Aspergillus sclerotioniger CBS 115572 TaxID=1450535 RepID=A0A317XAV3_9EURO|nr:hypothetical protein BO94DRAFT_542564 [Aspergillus sclerotioniger CBS 115572]PWY95311.1 hypothetical protein BO94DRAFT_542564 [Aspergillus sclerotioniger CBS 115572]